MSTAEAPSGSTEFVDFWKEILVPKFTRYRHVLVGGLTHHSAKVFPSLEAGDEAVQRHDEIAAAFKAELAKYETAEGIVMDSSSWNITARNPG